MVKHKIVVFRLQLRDTASSHTLQSTLQGCDVLPANAKLVA